MNSSVTFEQITSQGLIHFRSDMRRYSFEPDRSIDFVHHPDNFDLSLPDYAVAGKLDIMTTGWLPVKLMDVVAYGSSEFAADEPSYDKSSLFEGWLLSGMCFVYASIVDGVEIKLTSTQRIQSIEQ